MIIKLPQINGENKIIENFQSIVLIGANGSGKTRMSVWIENNNVGTPVHRISAQKSLNMPQNISPKDIDVALKELYFGYNVNNIKNNEQLNMVQKNSFRWSKNPNIASLNDFDKLMTYLVSENYQKNLEYRQEHQKGNSEYNNTTYLDEIKTLWERVLPHRKLKISTGKIEAAIIKSEEYYNCSEMSDGERAIFYFIGEVLSAPNESIIIIDEPENHLHKSILFKLWNEIEKYRKDCLFVYVTHNIDFAVSRINSKLIWLKNYDGKETWNYETIEEDTLLDPLMIEMLGNRQNVLFIEGKSDSYDYKIYSELFKEYTVIPSGSCDKVIEITRVYNSMSDLNYLNAKGIIDRDRRNDEQIEKYKELNIFSPKVAEIENIFLIPELIKEYLKFKLKNNDEQNNIIENTKVGVFNFLERNKEGQALLYTKKSVNNKLYELFTGKSTNIEDYMILISKQFDEINIKVQYDEYVTLIDNIIKSKDYNNALKFINHKGLLTECGLISELGMNQSSYIDELIRLIYSDKNEGEAIKNILKKYIIII